MDRPSPGTATSEGRRARGCGGATVRVRLWMLAGSLRWTHGRPAPPQRGLLRPRQDDHRQVEHPRLLQAVPGRRADLARRGAPLGVRPVRLRRRRRRPRPDREDAGVHVDAGRRLGRRDRPRHRRRHPPQRRRPAGLRRGGEPDRGAQGRRSRHRHRLHERHRGGRADRRDARRGHRDRQPARGGRRQVHRGTSTTTRTPRRRPAPSSSWPASAATTSSAATPTATR